MKNKPKSAKMHEPNKPYLYNHIPNKTHFKEVQRTKIEDGTSLEEVLEIIDKNNVKVYFEIDKEFDSDDGYKPICFLVQKREYPNENYERELKEYELSKERYEREMKKYEEDMKEYQKYLDNKKEEEQKRLYEYLKKKYEG